MYKLHNTSACLNGYFSFKNDQEPYLDYGKSSNMYRTRLPYIGVSK